MYCVVLGNIYDLEHGAKGQQQLCCSSNVLMTCIFMSQSQEKQENTVNTRGILSHIWLFFCFFLCVLSTGQQSYNGVIVAPQTAKDHRILQKIKSKFTISEVTVKGRSAMEVKLL